jgi:hypothetical protein
MIPQDKLKAYLEAERKKLEEKTVKTEADKKSIGQLAKTIASPSYKGLTFEQAQGALGPGVGGSTETKGTGKYQYQYKTAPPKYLYDEAGNLQTGSDGKPLINPIYREGKLGSVFLATNLALQNAGGAQADPFSKLGATLAGVFGGIFMKNIGADINYYRASEQVKAENKEAIATSAAGARADSASLTFQKNDWKLDFDKKLGDIKLEGAKIKEADERLDFNKNLYRSMTSTLSMNGIGDDEELNPFVKRRMKQVKTDILLGMGYTQEDIDGFGGVDAFPDSAILGAKVKNYGNIKIFEDETGMPLGPVFVNGKLVASEKYAETLQEAISTDNGVDLVDVEAAWKRATTFVNENSAVKQELDKLRGKAREQQKFGLIKSYANLIVKRANAKNKNTAIMIGGEAYNADEMFSGFTLTKDVKEVEPSQETPNQQTPKVDDPFKNVYTIEGNTFSNSDYDSLSEEKKKLGNLTNPNSNQSSRLKFVNNALGLLDRVRKAMAISHDVPTVTKLAAGNDFGQINKKYLELLSKANYFQNPPEDLKRSIGILNDKIVERLGPAPVPLTELGTRFIPGFIDNEYQYVADYGFDPSEENTTEYKYAQSLVDYYNKKRLQTQHKNSTRVPLVLEDDKGKQEVYRLQYVARPTQGFPFIRISKVKDNQAK